MMKKSHWLNKIIFPVAILTTLAFDASAQKLSTVQEGSLWAPQKVKIDGKIEEWGDNFQAYNKTTKLYYTLSNDDKNLYLVVRSEDVQNSTKVMGGGVTLTINTSDKKKEENAFSVKFPIVNRNSLRGIRRPRGASQTTAMDSASMAEAAAARKQVIASLKEISVLGFKDITDTLISIYNEYGIKASAGYDDKANLQYELAIPLSLLNISTDRPKEFAYNIKVNGIDFSGGRRPGGDGGPGGNGGGRNGGAGGGNAGGGGGFGGGGGGGRNGGGGGGGFGGGGLGQGGATNNPMNELLSPTDFWGKYTLAKKPASFGLTNN